jgi:glycosyltransferase involved in cell wall biosynthesis
MEDRVNRMDHGEPVIDVIIPALNEEKSIGLVIENIPGSMVRNIIVVDNGSADDTVATAMGKGAIVLKEGERGYGAACLRGLEFIHDAKPHPDIVVFLDGDFSDHPDELPLITGPILKNGQDLVIGSRVLGNREPGSLTPQQVFGNKLATWLLNKLFRTNYTDLGPFRAIRFDKLTSLGMKDRNYGWTVEMQLKAARNDLRISEVPVSYRNRIGRSKVSGTIKGSIMAGYKILFTIAKYAVR